METDAAHKRGHEETLQDEEPRHPVLYQPIFVADDLAGKVELLPSVMEGRGRSLFDAVQRLDLEGIVAKRKTDSSRPETVWYKI